MLEDYIKIVANPIIPKDKKELRQTKLKYVE
jgi:hypothetical protein